MIQFNQIKEKTKEAFDKNEFFEFLMGYNEYGFRVMDAPVDVPTDWTRIIPNGIYELYKDSKNEEVINKYEEAIAKSLNGDCKELWCGVNILFFQLEQENMKESPFIIDKKIMNGLEEKIMEKENDLKNSYISPFGGTSKYNDIVRLRCNFNKHWNQDLFVK